MERLAAGTQFGAYRIEGLVASGGMGAVYAARDTVYGSVVALKVLHERHHAHPSWRERFNVEGVVGSRLKHPHVLSARDLVSEGNRLALVLDLVPGGLTLDRAVAREFPDGLPAVAALEVLRAVVQGVEYLHGKDIVHGDLKPENVLIEGETRRPETWKPLVSDFGTVGLVAVPVVVQGREARVASPRYASPEHAYGLRALEPRSDIFCLGLLLYFLLVGRHASSARTVDEAVAFCRQEVSLDALSGQPEAVLRLVRRCLALDPVDRYASCRELALALREALDALGASLALPDLSGELATEVDEERQRRQGGEAPAGGRPAPAAITDGPDPSAVWRTEVQPAPALPPASPWWERPLGVVGFGVAVGLLAAVAVGALWVAGG